MKNRQVDRVDNQEAPQIRERYESHEHHFSDWSQSLKFEKRLLGRLIQFIDKRLFLRSSVLILVFCLLLSYLIFIPIHYPNQIRVGELAQRDLISPYSFEMTDEVTTEDKRIKAEMAVLPLFDFDPQIFEKLALNIHKAFKDARLYLRENKKPNLAFLESQVEGTLGINVADLSFDWLFENRFSARVENSLIRILENWYDLKIAESMDRNIPSTQNQITGRVVHQSGVGKEMLINKKEITEIDDTEVFQELDRKTKELFSEADQNHIAILARALLQPNLTFNKSESAIRKQAARESVLPVTISIKRNQVIVSSGQMIQPFHKAVFRSIESMQNDRRKFYMIVALALMLGLSIFVLHGYIQRFTLNRARVEVKDLFVMMLITFSVIAFIKFYLFVADLAFVSRHGGFLTHTLFLAAAPVAAAPMMVGLLISYGEIVWLFNVFFALSLGVMEDFHFGLMMMTLVGGIAGASGVFNCQTRKDIYWAGVRTGLVNSLIFGFFLFVTKVSQDESLLEVWFIIPAAFLGGVFSSLLTLMVIPLLETLFNYTTDVKLLELSNLNHPLLREMIVKAPGTYHHSMMVGNMVEAAAEEIGANALLGKVMSYYHDIGKIEHAEYFIENQKPGHNPHDHISPFLSKTLLIAHVKDGVEIGLKHKLGQPIIDAILQHHGTTVISYFYNKALDSQDEDSPEIRDEEFRYPGPKPQFKEAALCMLADSIEAAARSLDEPTPQRLQSIVSSVIQKKFVDGQLDECNLSLHELTKIEKAFVRILLGVYHQRIAYPSGEGKMIDTKNKSGILK